MELRVAMRPDQRVYFPEVSLRKHMARVVKCPQLNVRQRTREVKADPTRWKRRMPSRYDQARHGQVDNDSEA